MPKSLDFLEDDNKIRGLEIAQATPSTGITCQPKNILIF